LRARKKQQTRAAIQRQALRLFARKGYDATTVEEIAAAAGVSHMTFFRYFPTKEDVVLTDDYDPLLTRMIAARPADEPIVESIRLALKEGFAQVYAADRDAVLARTQLIMRTPALRARLGEHGGDTEQLFTRTVAERLGGKVSDLRVRVVAAACLAAITTAILTWAESGGKQDLPDMVDRALTLLRKELC
jgi:AcrR family transcriptional regulator